MLSVYISVYVECVYISVYVECVYISVYYVECVYKLVYLNNVTLVLLADGVVHKRSMYEIINVCFCVFSVCLF